MTKSTAHILTQNHKGSDYTFAFVCLGSVTATVMIFPDNHSVVSFASTENARLRYAESRSEGASVGAPVQAAVGVSGVRHDYRPFVEINGYRHYGKKGAWRAARLAA